MHFLLNYYSVSLFMGGVVAILSGAAVFFNRDRRPEGIPWMLLNISTAVWSFGYFSMIISNDRDVAVFSDLILHYGAILIPVFYFYFIITLTKTLERYLKVLLAFLPFTVFFVVMNATNLFVKDVFPKPPLAFAPDAGPIYIFFTIYFFAITILAQIILYKKIKSLDKKEKSRLWFVFFSALFGFIGGGSVFFLTFNVPFPPYFLPLFAFYPIIITFAILRYKLFDVKIISTELLTGILWVVLLFRAILSENLNDQIISGIILIFTTIFGILLIRSVYREVDQREKIEHLAGQLENFIHFLSHEVKGILGKNRIMFEAIKDGDYGNIPDQLKPMIEQSFKDTTNSVNMVMNVLQSSDIKNGKLVMNKEKFNFKIAVKDIIEKMRPDIVNKGLKLETKIYDQGDCFVYGDKEKIDEHVIRNLLGNAIIYTASGEITVGLSRDKDNVRFFVKDSGIGLSESTKAKLFTEGGKGDESSKVNVHSTGYGLYFAKGIIDAHSGKIWAESEGAGKGSTFYVELKCV